MSDQILFPFFTIAAGLNLALAIYGWLHRRMPGAIAFSIAMLMFAVLPLMQAWNESNSDITIKIIALKSTVVAAGIGAIAWLVMIMQLTGYQRKVTWRFLVVISIVPVIFFILNWTENSLFRSGYSLDSSGNLQWDLGALFWLGFFLLNFAFFVSIYLPWRAYRHGSALSLEQTMALSLATILPIAANTLLQFKLVAFPAINFPLAVGPLMGVIVAWAVYRFRLFDIVPFPRSRLIESMSDAVLVIDSHNRIVDVNPAMLALVNTLQIGQSAESAFAKWPDLLARFRDVQDAPTEIFMDEEPPQYFDLRISPLFDDANQLTGRLLVLRDITALKQNEKRLEIQAAALKAAANAIAIMDSDGWIQWVNPAFTYLTGYSTEECIGRNVQLLRSDKHSDEFYKTLWDTIQSGLVWEDEVSTIRKDGSEYVEQQTITPIRDESGKITHMIAIKQDITARRHMEEALAQERDLLQALLDNIPDTIYFKDTESRFIRINTAQAKLLGVANPYDALGKTDLDFQPKELALKFIEEEKRILESGEPIVDRIEYNPTPDGTPRWFSATKAPLKNEHGDTVGLVGSSRNITKRMLAEEALRETEARYRTLVEELPAVVYIDAADQVATNLYISPQVEALFGYPLAEWKQDPFFWEKHLYPEDREKAKSMIHKSLRDESAVAEYRMISKDKRVVWVRDHARLIRDSHGTPRYVQGFMEDITEHRHNEELLQRQNKYFETLHEITLDLINQRATDELLQTIVSRAAEFLDVPFCELLLLEGNDLVVQAFTENTAFLMGDRVKRQEAHLSWQAFDRRSPVVVNDYFHWSVKRATYEDMHLSAVAAIPILVGGNSIGVIELSTSQSGYVFDHSAIEAASLFAQLAGLALNNAALYANAQHEITQRIRSAETLHTQNSYLSALHEVTLGLINRLDPDAVLEAILTHVTTFMNTTHALVEIVDPIANVLVQKVGLGNYVSHIGFHTPLGAGLTGRVWQSGEPLVIADYSNWEERIDEFAWMRSVAGFPMKVKGRVIGVIGISFDEPGRGFKPEEIELLQRFADLASVALDHAQLVTSAMRQSQELRLLHEVRTAITRELDITRIATRTVEAIADTFGYTLVSLYMVEGDALVLQHEVGYETVIPKIPLTKGVMGRVLQTGEPVLLQDVRADPAFIGAIEGVESEVAVPLLDEGKPVGVLNIESRQGIKMTAADLQLMIALSEQINIAISRARVYSTLQRKSDRLSSLHEITLELLNQRKMDELSQTITDQIVRLLDAKVGYVALRDGEELAEYAVTPSNFGYELSRLGPADSDSPVWQVYQTHQPFVTDNLSVLPNVRLQTAGLGLKPVLLLPILYGERCQGVVGAARFTAAPFDEDDISFGTLFSKLAALALDNAQLHETLRQESIRDPLTGLFNRRYMQETLNQELRRAERSSRALTVAIMDLDHFKHINDLFGHDVGDDALRKLGLVLRNYFRGSDIACRYGGEEFTLILPDASMPEVIHRLDELREDIKKLTITQNRNAIAHLSTSIGVAVYPQHGTTSEQLLKIADEALYRAKQLGRDRVVVASGTEQTGAQNQT